MPHFIIHCSENVLKICPEKKLIEIVHNTADSTGLFAPGNIKVRALSFSTYTVGGTSNDFLHIFGHIMSGRTKEQKANLSKKIISVLKPIFPDVPVLSINIDEFDKETYCNKNMV